MIQANFLSPSLFSLHDDGKGVEELTSLFPQVVPASAEQTEHAWATGRVAKAATLREVQRDKKYGRLIGGLTYHVR